MIKPLSFYLLSAAVLCLGFCVILLSIIQKKMMKIISDIIDLLDKVLK